MEPPLWPNRDVARSLVVVEVTCMLSSYKTSPVFSLTTFVSTISWKCSLKDDRIRSSLIECQSFVNRKIDVDPIYRVLVFLPMRYASIVHDVVHSNQFLQDLYALCPWDQ